MNKLQLLDEYPVFVENVAKADTDCANADDAIACLRAQVEAKRGAALIGVFDHRGHVAALPEGKIAEEIIDSKHLLFCLSNDTPNPLIAAVCPRAVSVVELADRVRHQLPRGLGGGPEPGQRRVDRGAAQGMNCAAPVPAPFGGTCKKKGGAPAVRPFAPRRRSTGGRCLAAPTLSRTPGRRGHVRSRPIPAAAQVTRASMRRLRVMRAHPRPVTNQRT